MPYPVDQLAGLAKANLGLMLKLAEVARKGGEESLEVSNKAAERFAEEARASIASATDKTTDPATPSPAAPTVFFADMEAVREHMIAGTKAAFEEWQQAWKQAASVPAGAGPLDMFGALLGPLFGQKAPDDGASGSNKR